MADWRQGDSGKDTPKPKKPKQKKQKKTAQPQLNPKPTGGWKGKAAAARKPLTTGLGDKRSWTGTAPQGEALTASTMRKWLSVGVLLVSFLLLTGWFIFYVWWKPPKLPLFVFSVGEYASPELLENPFGDLQRNRLGGLNEKNVRAHIKTNAKNNDNALSALGSASWLEGFDDVANMVVSGGGPSGKVVAFYISAFASMSDDDQLRLYPQGTTPFEVRESSKPGLTLKDTLENLAQSVDSSTFAWVILDLQFPLVVSNLGDLDARWRTAAEHALTSLESDLQDRLLITLPCDNGQQNWLAPEYSSSFFGHYIGQLLEGKFAEESMMKTSLTVGEFRTLLNEKVTNAVSNRRYAQQHPVWIPESNLERAAFIQLVTISDQDTAPQKTEIVEEHLDAIDSLWQQVSDGEYQRAYRWDPLGYAKVESNLLELEGVVVHQSGAFSTARTQVERAWNRLNKPAVGFQVSLLEDKLRERFFHGVNTRRDYGAIEDLATQLADEVASSGDAMPGFWKTSPDAETEQETPTRPENELPSGDRPFLVWEFYLECAQRQNAPLWARVFEPNRLRTAIAYAGQSEPNWLEIYLLHRIASDIDWQFDNHDRSQACAKTIVLYDRLQRLAGRPEPELSWWLRESLPPIEQQFLRGFDWLLAGKPEQALIELEQVAIQLGPLEAKLDGLASFIASANEALHSIPHLLAWLQREYQFAPDQDVSQLETRLKELGELVNLTRKVYEYLARPPSSGIDSGLNEAGRRLDQIHASLKQAFETYVERKTSWKATGAASDSPQTFRREMIALRSPLLDLGARRKLHANMRAFLGVDLPENLDQSNENMPALRSANDAADGFLASIESERDKWGGIAKGDARRTLEDEFTKSKQPDVNNILELRTKLLGIEYWQRAYASSFGSFSSLHNRLADDDAGGGSWPWSCAWQRWNLSATHNRLFQVERLAEASWGNGEFSPRWKAGQFFFGQLARQYDIPNGFSILEPAGQLANQLRSEMNAAVNNGVKRLTSMQVRFGEPNQSIAKQGEQRAPITISGGDAWTGIANVFMGDQQQRRPWKFSQPDETSWTADLAESRRTMQTFDARHWSNPQRPPQGTIAIRGNFRTESIKWRTRENQKQAVELVLNQETQNGAVVRVLPPKQAPPITVLMLIDCSKSMETTVTNISEDGRKSNVQVFELVKRNAVGVLERLEEIHGRDANIRLGLIAFGLEPRAIGRNRNLAAFLVKPIGGVGRASRIDPLRGDWPSDVEMAINQLEPSGDTPLYDAIAAACQIAQERADQKTLMFVFTDGVHYINDVKQRATSKTVSDVRRLIAQNHQLQLSIFHFDYFNTWVRKQKPEFRARWKRVFDDGRRELDGLKTLGAGQYGYYRSEQATQLMHDSLQRIPRSTVTITSLNNSAAKLFQSEPAPLGSRIAIGNDYLPAQLDVAVNGPFGSATGQIELLGGEELLLAFSPGAQALEYGKQTSTGGMLRGSNPRGAKLQSDIFLARFAERLERSGKLSFELHFHNRNKDEFTRRPRFLVAEVAQRDDIRSGTLILADHRFIPQTHFPEARLSEIPWPKHGPAARVRVWASDTLPANVLQMKTIEPGETAKLTLGYAKIEYRNSGDSVIANVVYETTPPGPQERVVIICPNSTEAHRTFQVDTYQEEHQFTLSEQKKNMASQIYFSTIGDLVEAAEANQLTQFDFETINVKK